LFLVAMTGCGSSDSDRCERLGALCFELAQEHCVGKQCCECDCVAQGDGFQTLGSSCLCDPGGFDTQMEEIDGEANCIVSGFYIRATVPAMNECLQDTQACKQNLSDLISFCY